VATPPEPWTLFTDGSSCVDGSGAGLILTSPKRTEFTYALRFQFTASNNEAEYKALIAGLRIAAQMGMQNVQVNVDSKLVANQVLGTYVAKEENMIKYLEKVKGLVSGFANFSISQVPHSKNKKADALSKIASTSFAHLSKQVLVEILQEKLIQEKEVTTVVEEDGPTWMTPIMKYLKDGTLKLSIKARQYELMERTLYRRSFLKPWLRTTVSSGKGYATVILLADYAPGRKRYDMRVQRLSSTSPCTKKSAATANLNHGSVAVLQMRNRYSRSFPGIKARLGKGNKNWLEELPHVLWAYRTIIKSSHGDTLFSLTYDTEAVIPAEIRMPTYRIAMVDIVHNDEELRLNLNLLEEKRERAAICETKAKMKMTKYYNARVCGVAFRPGDFVYRSNDASHAAVGGKLGPK
ncbi:reverse transcriptase domain-containing protein, partial [Tanacetum coccineum]